MANVIDDTDDFNDAAAKNLLARLPFSLVISDPSQEDCPIIYVNRAFETVTGYSSAFALGRNCRFLQGDDRDQPARQTLRDAIENEQSASVDLRNYRADGEMFLNRLMIAPIHDDKGKLFAYMGIQTELGEDESVGTIALEEATRMVKETQHRVKNHLSMVASMIRMESQNRETKDGPHSFDTLARRVEALSLLYDEFTQTGVPTGGHQDVVSAGAYISRVAATVGALDARTSIRLNVDTDTVPMRTKNAANLGLIVSEILTNTFQHAFQGRSEGLVEVRLKEAGSDRIRLTISDDGVGLNGSDWPNNDSLGSRLVVSIARGLDGELNVSSIGSGTIVSLDMPYHLPTTIDNEGARTTFSVRDKASLADTRNGRA